MGLGAYGAHGLEKRVLALGYEADLAKRLDWFETGVKYHFYHALGLMLVGLIAERRESSRLNSIRARMVVCRNRSFQRLALRDDTAKRRVGANSARSRPWVVLRSSQAGLVLALGNTALNRKRSACGLAGCDTSNRLQALQLLGQPLPRDVQPTLDRADRGLEIVAHFQQRTTLQVKRHQCAAIERGQLSQAVPQLVVPLVRQQRIQAARHADCPDDPSLAVRPRSTEDVGCCD